MLRSTMMRTMGEDLLANNLASQGFTPSWPCSAIFQRIRDHGDYATTTFGLG